MFDNFTRHELEIIDILEWNDVSEILAYKFVKNRYIPKGELLDFFELIERVARNYGQSFYEENK